MKLFPPSETPCFNLLSLGQRGVGKTVFLAGSYAELNDAPQDHLQQKLWFDCEKEEDVRNLNSILEYVRKTGEYPPPTLKIKDFEFTLKQRTYKGVNTLCHFRWWDIPGEYCDFSHPDFQQMVLSSHSCCVFINGERLVKDPTYLHELEGLLKQVIAIATLVDQDAINYGFALIFTQCDRLGEGPISRLQIEENLQFLVTSLEAAEAKYQRFYSGIPIVAGEKGYHFKVEGSAAAFLWLVSELHKEAQFSHAQSALGNSLKPDVSSLKYWIGTPSRSLAWLLGIGAVLLGLTTAGLLLLGKISPSKNYQQITDEYIEQLEQAVAKNPQDMDSLSVLVDHYLGRGEVEKSIILLEQLVQQNPKDLDSQMKLATLYEITAQKQAAERVYDQILAQDPNHFKALLGKALIRNQQGDNVTAKSLLQKAEKSADSEEVRQQVRNAAEQLNIKL